MPSVLAPLNWPRPVVQVAAWRFGEEVQLPRGGVLLRAVQWVLKRNCSMTPRQLFSVYMLASAVTLGIGTVFWWHGATAVLPFAGLEALLLGMAFLVYARHATDRETLLLVDGELHVEHHWGRRVERCSFRSEWVRVEPARNEHSLLELSGEGRRIRVGRYLRPDMRQAFARELRSALRRSRAGAVRATEDLELGTPR